MKFILTSFLLLISISSMSKEVTEKMQVLSLKWDSSSSLYKVEFYGRAAVYQGRKDIYECLSKSIKAKNEVTINFKVPEMLITSCK